MFMLAACVDTENHIVLLALSIVEYKNISSRRYFLSYLKRAILEINTSTTTLISDYDRKLKWQIKSSI